MRNCLILLVVFLQEVNIHLHDEFNHTRIYELARQRHYIDVEVQGMLHIARNMLLNSSSVWMFWFGFLY
jgi:hypothetical protein